MENIITRNIKFESFEELVQLVDKHKGSAIAVLGLLVIGDVLNRNLNEFLHNLNSTIAQNGCVLDSKLGKITIPPGTACSTCNY